MVLPDPITITSGGGTKVFHPPHEQAHGGRSSDPVSYKAVFTKIS